MVFKEKKEGREEGRKEGGPNPTKTAGGGCSIVREANESSFGEGDGRAARIIASDARSQALPRASREGWAFIDKTRGISLLGNGPDHIPAGRSCCRSLAQRERRPGWQRADGSEAGAREMANPR